MLIRGISIISLPLFARLLSTTDYGIYNTFVAYASFLFVIIGLALHSSLKNAKIDYKGQIERYCSSITLLIIINALICLVVSLIGIQSIANGLGIKNKLLVPLIVIDSFTLAIITLYNSFLSLEYRSKEYILLSLLYTVSGVTISLLLIIGPFNSARYYGRIIGTILSGLIVTGYIIYTLFRNSKPQINIKYWRYGLVISLPIIPHGISQLVLSQFDRLMINKINGSAEAGIYSFAYNIGAIFQIIATSLDTSWSQWFFDQMEKKNYKEIEKTANIYLAAMSLGMIALLLVSPEVTLILGGEKYRNSIPAIMPIILSMYYTYLYYFPASIEYYMKKTKFIALGTIMAAILNILLNMIFIPRYGYIGAAYTTVVCYLLYYGIHVIIANRILEIKVYDLKQQIGWMLGSTCITFVSVLFSNKWIVRYVLLVAEGIIVILIIVKNRNVIQKSIRQILKK